MTRCTNLTPARFLNPPISFDSRLVEQKTCILVYTYLEQATLNYFIVIKIEERIFSTRLFHSSDDRLRERRVSRVTRR